MKTLQQKDEIRHGRTRSDGQMRDAMTTASISKIHRISVRIDTDGNVINTNPKP